MLKNVMIVAAAVALVAPAASARAVSGPQMQQTVPGVSNQNAAGRLLAAFTLSCISFQVDDMAPSIQFTNDGPGIVPAGTKLHWVVKQSSGDYVVPHPIAVHYITVLNGVARSGIGGCTITVVN